MIHQSQYRIYYEDTDAQGVVYYANYLKFFERARTDFLREKNISQAELMEKEKLFFVVKKCQIEYKDSAILDDLITVKTSVVEVSITSVIMHQQIFKGEKLLTNLDVQLVCIDANSKRPAKIPENILTYFNKSHV